MSSSPSVAAVIVTYNRLEKLRLTLERTLAQPFAQVIVIDNASTDGTGDYLREIGDARLRLVHETENRGGAGGFMRGFELAAQESGADWLVCYDDDAYPSPDALVRFADLALGPDVGGVAASVYFPDGSICPMNRPGMDIFHSPLVLARALLRPGRAVGLDDEAYQGHAPLPVSFSSFVGLFVRCDLVRDVLGLPQADLFIYRDDSLYTMALTKAGYKLLFAPDLRFVHDCTTSSSGKRIYSPLWKAYYVIRNDLYFFRAFAGAYFYAILPLLMVKFLSSVLFYDDPSLFLRIAKIAFLDGIRKDFSRSHATVLTLAVRAMAEFG
nr:glycosyltransferase [uncultured Acidocella sp.]